MSVEDEGDLEKHRIHIGIFAYQHQYLEEHGYNISKVVRQSLDDRIEQDGADPETLRQVYGSE